MWLVIVADIVEIVVVYGCGVVGRLGTLHPRKSLTLFVHFVVEGFACGFVTDFLFFLLLFGFCFFDGCGGLGCGRGEGVDYVFAFVGFCSLHEVF